MELPGKSKRGRPKRWFMDVVKEDMGEVEVTEDDTDDRSNWRWKIRCADPWWKKPKEEEDYYINCITLVSQTHTQTYTKI